MRRMTAAIAVVRTWFAAIWGPQREKEVARQYAVAASLLRDQCPLMLADFSKFCLAFDTTFDETSPYATARNEGKREAWLYLQAALTITPADLQALSYATEDDDNAP